MRKATKTDEKLYRTTVMQCKRLACLSNHLSPLNICFWSYNRHKMLASIQINSLPLSSPTRVLKKYAAILFPFNKKGSDKLDCRNFETERPSQFKMLKTKWEFPMMAKQMAHLPDSLNPTSPQVPYHTDRVHTRNDPSGNDLLK